MPAVELLTLAVAIAIGVGSYFLLDRQPSDRPLTPPLVALLLVANLVPAIALLVLWGRRVAKKRAAQSPVGGGGRLHVRLVALFSVIAAVPTLLVVIFASLLFQYGVEFWFSDRARGMLENAGELAQGYYQEKRQDVAAETVTMAGDLRDYLGQARSDSPEFVEGYGWQVLSREFSESAIVSIGPDGTARTLAMVNPDSRPVERRVSPEIVGRLLRGESVVVTDSPDRIEAVTRLQPNTNTFLYNSRISDPQALAQTARAKAVLKDYDALLERSRVLQLRFNAALLLISLLVVGAAVWIALRVADRLVRPVGELVDAARKVTAGDLSARVATPRERDEIGTLANAFNRMTRRLEEQTQQLVGANDLLDRRRAFTEAVLSGVTAGVVSVDPDRSIRLMNSSAAALLKSGDHAVGRTLDEIAPELAAMLGKGDCEQVVQLTSGGEPRTLAVKIVVTDPGSVLTFDDITEQLLDQRRAAWSDVARRIAHEIKNPLTPIQLAAERLQRRYGKEIESDRSTFDRLTETIVRQVGDLRRMVDEFSSFARMPKPLFREEPVVDIGRQALFLHEVAHPTIRFSFDAPEPPPLLVCDRRQLGQALTNIVKNAVEAIERKEEIGEGFVSMRITEPDERRLIIEVADNGAGLPADRSRLFEPYMTTRARGTGLGLAIVKKIVEEHFGTIELKDRDGGGTLVCISLDREALAPLADANAEIEEERAPIALTRS
ncbi:HAMP domain-containing protein [Sphingomonas sp. ID1715]|uniref:sensor histidine kinase n=1 Tax=Sphingomonas sp. ID1715 TaxID=1656898 RepID=UPI001489931D|nr:ATP-binding protein [Sphingomonas sp. ID1715]NNM75408.1 HAMP domain-containing protein [Sphingomonas sp. ID1715]